MTLDLITFTYRPDTRTVMRVSAEVEYSQEYGPVDGVPWFHSLDEGYISRIISLCYRKTDEETWHSLPDWAEPNIPLYRTLEDLAIKEYEAQYHSQPEAQLDPHDREGFYE